MFIVCVLVGGSFALVAAYIKAKYIRQLKGQKGHLFPNFKNLKENPWEEYLTLLQMNLPLWPVDEAEVAEFAAMRSSMKKNRNFALSFLCLAIIIPIISTRLTNH